MELSIVITAYLAVATFVTVSTFYAGVLNRRYERLFSVRAYTVMTLACIGVGLLWVLFLPGLVVLAIHRIAPPLAESWRRAFVNTRAVRVRG